MGLVLAMRVGDGITLTLPSGEMIHIINIERARPALGTKVLITAPKNVRIGRTQRTRDHGDRMEGEP